MFELWQKIEERGSVAIPIRPAALSRLEWAEVSELYPELVPDECRGYDVYSDERLISTCPFVRVGNAYKFTARMHEEDKGLDVFVDTRELVGMLCARNYHIGLADSLFDGPLTCSCGISGCDGIDGQTVHVSERMVRWDVLRYRQRYEFFFEREAYDVGVVRMLHDLCQEENGVDYKVGGGYEKRELAVEGVAGLDCLRDIHIIPTSGLSADSKCYNAWAMVNYEFSALNKTDNPAVIFRGIVGSHAYGTANAQSDTDVRGVFVVPSREYVRLVPPPKQVSDERNDRTYYSLLRFCELMAEANPTTMEMLYLPSDCILKTTPAFELFVKNREIFISQRAVNSHLGYAVSQIKKARGCNKRVWNPWPEEPPKPEDYCMFVADARKHPKTLSESGVDLRTCKAAPVAKNVVSDILSVYGYGTETGGVFRGGKPVVFDIPKEDAEKRIGILIFNKQAFESAKRQHQEYWNWKRNRNNARWVQQERGELDYDAKNMMHLTRLLFSGENIVKNGEPIVRFEGEKLAMLLSIRRGEWTFDEIMAHAEKIQAEIESGKGRLPVESDRARIDALIAEVMKVAEVA